MSIACACLAFTRPAGAQNLINFDVYPNAVPVMNGDAFTTQWAQWGVVFSDGGSGAPGPANNPCSYSLPNHASAANGLIVARFVDPCTGEPSVTNFAGTRQDWCWFSGEGIDMYAYDAQGNQIGHQFNAGGGNLVMFTFPTPVIARIEMTLVLQGIDDFVFNTPASVPNTCPADIGPGSSGDGQVNVTDLLSVISHWGPCGLGICTADVNCDRTVNVADLLAVISSWGACP